jgi:Zn-dependent protease with chaperone function
MSGNAPPPQPVVDLRKNIRNSFFKSLLVPFPVLVFFILAPYWLNSQVRSEYYDAIDKSEALTPPEKQERKADLAQVDFRAVCSSHSPPEYAELRKDLEDDGTVANFEELGWGLDFSILLMGVLVVAMAIIYALNLQAKKSREKLIWNYRLGYKIATTACLINLAILIPLLAYGTFEFTCLLSNEFSVQLLLAIVGGGLLLLWATVATFLKKVPLEFVEPMSRELTPGEAPELWQVVRTAAERLQTAPPDRIISGIQMNFYVTELAVKHDKGRVEGRTLFLSYPLLKQLSEDEVLAIIGHELGHFIGQDTRLTREFYPLKFKIHGTMLLLAQALWLGSPSLELLNFFTWCFEDTVQTVSRARELLADAQGASLTSPRTMARALVKFQVVLEVFQRNLNAALRHQGEAPPDPLKMDLKASIRQNLASDTGFWTQLFEKKLPHPLDSHPSLLIRLEGLGQTVSPDEAQAMAVEESPTAHARWLLERENLFTELSTQAEQAIGKMRVRAQAADADYQTAEGKALLDRLFPEVAWSAKQPSLWIIGSLLGSLILLTVLVLIYVPDGFVIGMLVLATVLTVIYIYAYWKTNHKARFILNAEGVYYTGWRHALHFREMENVSTLNVNSEIRLVFHFKQRQKCPSRFHPYFFKVKTVALPLARFQEKPMVIAQTVYNYFTRQTQ